MFSRIENRSLNMLSNSWSIKAKKNLIAQVFIVLQWIVAYQMQTYKLLKSEWIPFAVSQRIIGNSTTSMRIKSTQANETNSHESRTYIFHFDYPTVYGLSLAPREFFSIYFCVVVFFCSVVAVSSAKPEREIYSFLKCNSFDFVFRATKKTWT